MADLVSAVTFFKPLTNGAVYFFSAAASALASCIAPTAAKTDAVSRPAMVAASATIFFIWSAAWLAAVAVVGVGVVVVAVVVVVVGVSVVVVVVVVVPPPPPLATLGGLQLVETLAVAADKV